MRVVAALVLSFSISVGNFVPAQAAGGDRTLYLYYTHTKETAKITFKHGNRYDQAGLNKLNYFLRDWRRNEPTKMDPALFDLIWEVYQDVGATGPIHVVSAYRAPETNEMLRARSSAVAKNSRHTHGMAMDFFIPGVSLTKLRETAMRHQVGGVGYYPTSGSPFVHLDTGSVRAWPRMTHAQLEKVFPDGKTLHLPTDGVPLSQSGRTYAQAQWTKCHSVPCNGRSSATADVRVAANRDDGKPKRNLLDLIFGNDEEGDEGDVAAPIAVAAATPAPSAPAVVISAPTPFPRPAEIWQKGPDAILAVAALDAPIPARRPASLYQSVAESPVSAVRPATPTLLDPVGAQGTVLTAYAPSRENPPSEALRALEILLDRRAENAPLNTAPSGTKTQRALLTPDAIVTASLGGPADMGSLSRLFDGLHPSESQIRVHRPVIGSPVMREGELHAPDFAGVSKVLFTPEPMTSGHFANIVAHEASDFDPATELGRFAPQVHFGAEPGLGLVANRFVTGTSILTASR